MRDFLYFRTMITPLIMQILFWLAVLLSFVVAGYNLVHAHYRFAVEIIIAGPLLARIATELIIVFFRMNAALAKITTGLTHGKDD